jgi:hypothetical protein
MQIDMKLKLAALLQRFTKPRLGMRKLHRQHLVLDHMTLEGCSLEKCILSYGGGIVTLRNCSFTDCRWHLFGAASGAATFMRDLFDADPSLFLNTFPALAPLLNEKGLAYLHEGTAAQEEVDRE